MKNIFENENSKVKKSELSQGSFRKMMEAREEELPELKDSIRRALKDYSGQNIAIIIIDEDENGDAEGASVLIAGVGKLESQIAMAKTLHRASETIVEDLMEVSKGDVKAMLQIASAIISDTVDEDDKPKKGKKQYERLL